MKCRHLKPLPVGPQSGYFFSSSPESATQRERKAVELLDDLRAFSDTPARLAIVMRALGSEYQRGFTEAWEERDAESKESPATPRKKNPFTAVKNSESK